MFPIAVNLIHNGRNRKRPEEFMRSFAKASILLAALGWTLDRALVMLRDRLVYWEKLETYYV